MCIFHFNCQVPVLIFGYPPPYDHTIPSGGDVGIPAKRKGLNPEGPPYGFVAKIAYAGGVNSALLGFAFNWAHAAGRFIWKAIKGKNVGLPWLVTTAYYLSTPTALCVCLFQHPVNTDGASSYHRSTLDHPVDTTASGGIISTPRDMAKWFRALTRTPEVLGLDNATLRTIFTTGIPVPGNRLGLLYAQGILVQPDPQQPLGTRRIFYNGNRE